METKNCGFNECKEQVCSWQYYCHKHNNLSGKKIEYIKELFNTDKKKSIPCFSLVCLTDGMWTIKVHDGVKTWINKNIPEFCYKYSSSEEAVEKFLRHVFKYNINVRKLQEKE